MHAANGRWFVVVLVAASAGACASTAKSIDSVSQKPVVARPDDFGRTKATAIEVCGPRGQRQYLDRLRCSAGDAPTYDREGSFGPRTAAPSRPSDGGCDDLCETFGPVQPGEPDVHIVDGYAVTCAQGDPMTLFLDMYHCEAPPPDRAPDGFTIVPAGGGR